MRLLRIATANDYPLIYATWLRSQYYGNTWFKEIEQNTFYDNYKKIVLQRLTSSTIVISCLESDPDVILGYAVMSLDETVLHWVYVKRAWRRFGIAKEMVPETIKTVTSLTRVAKPLLKDRKFNPFL